MAYSTTSLRLTLVCAFFISSVSSYMEMSVQPDRTPVFYVQGKPLQLVCTVKTDNKSLTIFWSKAKVDLDEELKSEIKQMETGEGMVYTATLTIPEAGLDDETSYMCSTGGQATKVIDTQMISMYVRDANITEGQNTTLRCQADSSFDKTYSWTRNGLPLDEVPELAGRVVYGPGNSTVNIMDSKLTDSGVYKCEVTMGPANIAQTFEEKAMLNAKPYINPKGTNKDDLLKVSNESIHINCPTGGYPDPEVFWFKGDEMLESSDRVEIRGPDANGVAHLEITDPAPSDYGHYKCSAENSLGKSQMTFPVGIDDTNDGAAMVSHWSSVLWGMVFITGANFIAA